MKYEDDDLKAIANKEKSVSEIAIKYGVSSNAIRKALIRKGWFARKVRVKIITPYKTKTVSSIQECADELQLSSATIRKALNGETIKTLEELNVRLEIVENV